jgi:hypothetical protein
MQSRLPHNYKKHAYKDILGRKFYAKNGSDRFIPIAICIGMALGCASLPKLYQLVSPKIVLAPVVAASEGVTQVNAEAAAVAGQTPSADTPSILIEKAVDEFLSEHKSESLMIMHCLAHREARHGESKAMGDNGLAGGPFQFHEATWIRMRKQMIDSGLSHEVGSRFDFKESARTTAWAIKNGRALEWGPILRASKGSSYASCSKPSWYK